MKYIITDHNKIALGTGTYHAELASAVSGSVVAAGHMRIVNGKVEVYGESSGYGIKAKPEDADVIRSCLFSK